MKVQLITCLIFSFISTAACGGYRISKIEKCSGNDKEISVEKCFVIDESLLNLKVVVHEGLNYSLVRKIHWK